MMATLLRILPSFSALALYGLLVAIGGIGVSVAVENVSGFLGAI